jgi:hypothetical protein
MRKTHDGDDDAESRNNHGADREGKKLCKRFSADLVQLAMDSEWEDHELSRLIILIAKQLNFASKGSKVLKFLTQCQACKPIVLMSLLDEGIELTVSQIIYGIYGQAANVEAFTSTIGEGLEQGLFSLKDEDTVESVSSIQNHIP